jgi:hypothetical protein
MKSAKLFILLTLFASVFSFLVSAQANISDVKDADVLIDDVDLLITAHLPNAALSVKSSAFTTETRREKNEEAFKSTFEFPHFALSQ